jgi:hypothetical protein
VKALARSRRIFSADLTALQCLFHMLHTLGFSKKTWEPSSNFPFSNSKVNEFERSLLKNKYAKKVKALAKKHKKGFSADLTALHSMVSLRMEEESLTEKEVK